MVSEATIEAYKAMTNEQGCASMKVQIQENLERTCDKFAGNEDKLDRCISYLEDCASQILDGKSGDVPDEVCFRICRDYFNDEIWAEEDEAKAAKEAKRKAEREKLDKERERLEKLKEKHGLAEKIYEANGMKAEASREAKAAEELKKAQEARKADLCTGQMDFFALMGC